MTIPFPVRAAALAALLLMNGCGDLLSSGSGGATSGLNFAETALHSGAGQVALQVSESVLRASPNNTNAKEVKGDALTLLGQYDDATAVYQGLLAGDPNSVRANIGMGRIKLMSDPATAEALFQQVLKRQPKDLTALNNLGIARDLQGRHADAQVAYHQALAIDPGLKSAQVNLSLSMAMNGQGAAAVQMAKASASEPGASVKVKHDYAVVLAMAGNRSEAERVLSESMSPEAARQALDGMSESHGRTVRGLAPDPKEVHRVAEADMNARMPDAPPAARVATNVPPRTPAALVQAAPLPMVVRPLPAERQMAGVAVEQPTSPLAAVEATQQPLALSSVPAPPLESAPAPKRVPVPAQEIGLSQAGMPEAAVAPRAAIVPRAAPVSYLASSTTVRSEPVTTEHAPDPRSAARDNTHGDDGLSSVQFAAATSELSAHSYWQNLVHRYHDALGQREPSVVRVEHGHHVFWRLRTEGFETVAEAKALCARMRASGQDCFVPRS
jgi:Flp pilus assembly protein TadD